MCSTIHANLNLRWNVPPSASTRNLGPILEYRFIHNCSYIRFLPYYLSSSPSFSIMFKVLLALALLLPLLLFLVKSLLQAVLDQYLFYFRVAICVYLGSGFPYLCQISLPAVVHLGLPGVRAVAVLPHVAPPVAGLAPGVDVAVTLSS